MNIKVNFDNIKVKETKKDFTVKILMLKGEKGYSSYDLYVQHGGTLTEEQWLDAYLNAENYYTKDEVNNKIKEKLFYLDEYSSYCETIVKDNISYKDWLPAFNKAFDDGQTTIYLKGHTYYISDTIILNKIISLIGTGKNKTIIKLIPDQDVTNGAIIKVNYNYCEIKDLKIEGSSTSFNYNENDTKLTAGLHLANSNANHCLIDNVFIGRINGNGIKIDFTSYDIILKNITVNFCSENGIWCDATDVFMSKCICFRIDKHGFYITHGNNLIEQCKAYYTGMINETIPTETGCGFYESIYDGHNEHTNRYINCESQEAGWHGFYCNGSDGNQYIGCQSDTNGVFVDNSCGFYLTNVTNFFVKGIVVNKEYLGGSEETGLNKIGIYLNGIYNNIDLNIYVEQALLNGVSINTKFFDKLYDINKSVTNNVIINGFNVNKETYLNEMYIDTDNDGVANDFTLEKYGTNLVSNCSIDYTEMAQKIEISDSSSASVNNFVKIVKQISIPNGISKFSLSCERKENNNTNDCPLLFRVRCFDNTDTRLSNEEYKTTQSNFLGNSTSKTKWDMFYHNYDIVNNTSYIKLEILLNLNTVEGVNTALIKNLKYKLY